jgi:hypothetical protein
MRNDDLISTTLDSGLTWSRSELYSFARISRAWVKPSLMRLWRHFGTVVSLCDAADINWSPIKPDQFNRSDDWGIQLSGGKIEYHQVKIMKKYVAWMATFDNVHEIKTGARHVHNPNCNHWAPIHHTLLTQVIMLLKSACPFPSIRSFNLRSLHTIKGKGTDSSAKEFVRACPPGVVTVDFSVTLRNASLLEPFLLSLPSLKELVVREARNTTAQSPSIRIVARLLGPILAMNHLTHITIPPRWLTSPLAQVLGQLLSLISLCTRSKSDSARGEGSFSPCFVAQEEERMRIVPVAILPNSFLRLIEVELVLPSQVTDCVEILGPNLESTTITVVPNRYREAQSLREMEIGAMTRRLISLPKLRRLKLRLGEDNHASSASELHRVEYAFLKPFRAATQLNEFTLVCGPIPSTRPLDHIIVPSIDDIQDLVSGWSELTKLEINIPILSPAGVDWLTYILPSAPRLLELSMKLGGYPDKKSIADLEDINHGLKSLTIDGCCGRYDVLEPAESFASLCALLFKGPTLVHLSIGNHPWQFLFMLRWLLDGTPPEECWTAVRDPPIIVPAGLTRKIVEERCPTSDEFDKRTSSLDMKGRQWTKKRLKGPQNKSQCSGPMQWH